MSGLFQFSLTHGEVRIEMPEDITHDDYELLSEWLKMVDATLKRRAENPARLKCADCGLPYTMFPCDCNVTDEEWNRVMGKPGGVLCPTCLARRLIEKIEGTTYVTMVPKP